MSGFFDDDADVQRPTGAELAREGAERAARAAGEPWREAAFRLFFEHAKTHARFTTEDVRLANVGFPEPPDGRAWGAIALRAQRAGYVRSVGQARMKSPHVHDAYCTLWESRICET